MSNIPQFGPHELKTVEIDVEKKIFKVNGEDFGKGCNELAIFCTPPSWNIRMELTEKIIYEKYDLDGKHIEENVIHSGQGN